MHGTHAHARLIASAVADGGIATVAMAISCGVPRRSFYALVEREGWPRIQVGSWAVPGVEVTWRHHLRAALHHLGAPSAASGLAALHLHGLERLAAPREVLVATTHERRVTGLRQPVAVTRSLLLRQQDVVVRRGLPVVVPAWALAHFARTHSRRRVLVALTVARQAGVVTLDEVDEVLARAVGMPGVPGLRHARQRFDVDQPDSGLEWDIRTLLRRHALAPDPSPFPFALPTSVVIHLDVPFPWAWAAWEGEAFATHGGSERVFDRDRDRFTAARRAGWDVRFVTRSRLERDPDGIAEEVREVLAAADPERPPPRPTRCPRRTCGACRARFGPDPA